MELLPYHMLGLDKYKACLLYTSRIEYLAGKKAINYIINRDDNLSKICKYLSCSDEDSIKGIENINNKLTDSIKENKRLKEEIAVSYTHLNYKVFTI